MNPVEKNFWNWIALNYNDSKYNVLEIGSRSVVSDSLWKQHIPKSNYTGFDVLPGENVDIVGDAHILSHYFTQNSFDLVISCAVFEHLAMPWIVAEEISKVLRPSGSVAVETHFSFSEHELPWHFFQFNPNALRVLFNNRLGFNVIHSSLSTPMVGRFSSRAGGDLPGKAISNLYCHSAIVATKVKCCSDQILSNTIWHKSVNDITSSSMYPDKTGLAS